MNRADSVAKVGAIISLRSANGTMMNGKDDSISLVGRQHFDTRLATRPLLGKHKFAAFEVPASLAQEESDLKRKDNFTVQILVQTVEITGSVLQ